MKHKQSKLSALLLLVIGLTGIQAQEIHEAIPASGGNASGSGGSVAYSTGQVVYLTRAGTNGSVAEGIQQPYEISEITGLDEAKNIILTVLAYPNPVTEYLTLTVEPLELSALSFQLYNVDGNLLLSRKIISNETNIAMGNLAPSTYFVKVTQNDKEIKAFKIIKY